MERGPLALFGAIIAVGLGPALWMGVQLGVAQQGGPARPPSIGEYTPEPAQNLLGGAGAGGQTGNDTTPVETVRPSPSTSATDPSPSKSPTRKVTTPPTTKPTTEPTEEPSTSEPSSGTTSEPTTDPTDQDPPYTEPPTGDQTDGPSDNGDGNGEDAGEGDDDWWTYEDTDPPVGDYGNYASAQGAGGR